MIEVVVGVSPAGIMSYPFAVGVNVRGVGMPFSVVIIAVFFNGVGLAFFHGGRTLRGNIPLTLLRAAMLFALTLSVLRKSGDRKHQQNRENCTQFVQINLQVRPIPCFP
jgi:hypothetical protein